MYFGVQRNIWWITFKIRGVSDLAMFGKALGNGYAITSVIGRREVMEHAQSSFISSTFLDRRIGSVAALATLSVMEETRSWETVTNLGLTIKKIGKKQRRKQC